MFIWRQTVYKVLCYYGSFHNRDLKFQSHLYCPWRLGHYMAIVTISLMTFRSLFMHLRYTSFSRSSLTTFRWPLKTHCAKSRNWGCRITTVWSYLVVLRGVLFGVIGSGQISRMSRSSMTFQSLDVFLLTIDCMLYLSLCAFLFPTNYRCHKHSSFFPFFFLSVLRLLIHSFFFQCLSLSSSFCMA